MTLDVRDDGDGFVAAQSQAAGTSRADGASQASGGFGLIAMRQRVNRLAGQLEIESEPGAGTAVSASLPAIPLDPPPQAAMAGPAAMAGHAAMAGPRSHGRARSHGRGVVVTGIIRLLIADDHPVVRDGLRGIFEASSEFEVVGEAASGREAVDRAAALRPDVVLMDLRMPELDGVSAIRMLAQRGVGSRVLVLTTFDTDTDVVPAIEAGATGYLLKDSPPEELLRGVRAAARGEAVLSPSVATRLLGQVRAPARNRSASASLTSSA